ncbi:Cc8l18.2-like protein [Plakobranchus ocellatus]|uniref:Cc8l18.2-like protein n=1 Tax=Plakobranchus ocellatus TaxID=259542 RepID=A0AAV3YDG0_9GAST|nr:Cc8l18.2-like protein [Plakobranchus ocellatus]
MGHSLMFLSDDIQHDYHAVHHYKVKSIEVLKKVTPAISRVFIFSDGCAGQYKGKGKFVDLSLYIGIQVQRSSFGSEHGKGEAGVFNLVIVLFSLNISITSSLDEAFCEDINDDGKEVEPQSHTEVVAEEEIMASFLKQHGKGYVFPDVPEICAIGALEIFKILSPPTIDNRNRH